MSKYLEHIEFNGTDIILRDAEARNLIQENVDEIASVKAKANLNEQKIDALTPRVTAAEEDIVALDGRLDTAEDDIDSLELHMSAAEDDIDALEDRVTSLEGTVDSLEDRMDAAEGDIDALEGRMDAAEGDIDNLQDAVDQHADLIDGLSDDVSALEDRMDAVEDKNDAQDDKLDELDRKIAASTYEAGIGIYFGQGVEHTNINVEDELITEIHNSTTKNIEQDTRLTNIENGTTKLPYGKALSITPSGNDQNLNLLDPNNNVLSSVQLPKSGTQLKYDDEGTLTNIDEATLGDYLYYDEDDGTINVDMPRKTGVYGPPPIPGSIEITSASKNYAKMSISAVTIDGTSYTASTLGTFDADVGDFFEVDFSAVSTVLDQIGVQTSLVLEYYDSGAGIDKTLMTIDNFDYATISVNQYKTLILITTDNTGNGYGAVELSAIGRTFHDDIYVGEGLTVDDGHNLKCTVEPGTKVFPVPSSTTPLEVQVQSVTIWEEWDFYFIQPNELYIPSTSTTINTNTDFLNFLNSRSVGEHLLIDFSAVSSDLTSIPAAQDGNTLMYNDGWSSGYLRLDNVSVAAIVAAGYTPEVEVFQVDGSGGDLSRLYDGSMYDHIHFENKNFAVDRATGKVSLKDGDIVRVYRAAYDAATTDSSGAILNLNLDLTSNKYKIGDLVLVDSIVNLDSAQYQYKYAYLNGLLGPNLFKAGHPILLQRVNNNYQSFLDWDVVNDNYKRSYLEDLTFSTMDMSEDTLLYIVGGYADNIGIYTWNSFYGDYPQYVPYDFANSTQPTPIEYGYAENDKMRVELFKYSSAPSYDGVKFYDKAVPYVPSLISCDNNIVGSSEVYKNLGAALANASDKSFRLSSTGIQKNYVMIIYYK